MGIKHTRWSWVPRRQQQEDRKFLWRLMGTLSNLHNQKKLLGGIIPEEMKWKEHLLGSDQSLVRQLTSRINGLLKVSSRAPFHTRLMVANGDFMSKLCYLIQLWGGCEKYLFRALQIIQNRAARAVTGKSWFTPVRRLL